MKTSLRIGFVLLVGATLAIGVLTLKLLRGEEVRLAAEARQALQARVQVLADDVQLAVQSVEDELAGRLAALRADEIPGVPAAWAGSNPLIRNAFVWRSAAHHLEYPDPAAPATAEERQFVQRYEHLFADRLAAQLRDGAAEDAAASPAPVSPRLGLQRAARQAQADRPAAPVRHGWIPWFEGDQIYLLGWVERGDLVYGVELETMLLLSRLTQAFPPERGMDRAWVLLDGGGRMVHQSGGLEVRDTRHPVAAAGLGPALPHWQVALFVAPHAGSGAVAGGYRLISRLLVAALLVSILAGGTLLLLEAGRRAREARQKTTFVSNVSHELKTPLTTIRLYAELLRDGRVGGEDKRRHYLDVMVAECARLTRLLNNMLDFSRLEQNRRTYAPEPLELTAWLAAFVEQHRVRVEEAGMRMTLRAPAAPVNVAVDRDALEQTLLNLLDNAVKYAATGGLLEVELGAQSGGAWIDVRDRGPGVPADRREKIFEKFFRLDQSLTARVPGSGLGLSIARRLMRDMGGDVACLAGDGGGARFRIVLKAG